MDAPNQPGTVISQNHGRSGPRARTFLIIVALTFALKLILLLRLKNLPLLGDDLLYWNRSLDTLHNYFRQLDWQAPLFPIYIALNRIFFGGHAVTIIKAELILLQSAEAIFIYLIARRYFSSRAALAAGILACLYPELAAYGYLLFSETFFLAFMLGAFLLYFSALRAERGNFPGLACAGILNGLACLVRGNNLYFLPFVLAHLLIFLKQPVRRRILAALLFAVATIAPVSVQTVKNYRVAGCFIANEVSPLKNLYLLFNESYPVNMDFRGNSKLDAAKPACPEDNICEEAKCQRRHALEFIAAHPGLSLKHALIKGINLYSPNLIIYKNIFWLDLDAHPELKILQGRWFRVICSGAYLALMLLFLLGLCASREWELRSFTILLVLFVTAGCMVFLGGSRYRMPFVPFLVIYAGTVLGMRKKDWAESKWPALAAALAWAILVLAEFNRLLAILK